MGYYLGTDSGGQLPLATVAGWAAFGRWADALDAAAYPDLVHLVEHSWAEPASAVRDQLAAALEGSPPDGRDTAHTARQLLDALAGLPADAAVVVSDGMAADPADGEAD